MQEESSTIMVSAAGTVVLYWVCRGANDKSWFDSFVVWMFWFYDQEVKLLYSIHFKINLDKLQLYFSNTVK